MFNKNLILIICSFAFCSLAQNINPSCNFKKLGKLITKIDGHYSKSDLDQLFGTEGILTSDPKLPDSLVKTYNYQFCDTDLKHTCMVAFIKGKLIYVLKSFPSVNDCGKEKDFEKTLNKKYTYEDVKNKFGMEGDIYMITWNPATSEQEQIEYIWRCCDKYTYYTVVFKNGEMCSSSRYPMKQDYSRPSNGKR